MSNTSKKLNNLKTALDWAKAGFYIFPCVPGTTAPISFPDTPKGEGGFKLATIDAGQIEKWWTECPEANIGCYPDPSGHFVIDIDDKGDKHGSQTLERLEAEHGRLPDTFTVRTPTGGRHLWFTGRVKSSVERMGPGLDTRGVGGYVLLPGSIRPDGEYSTERSDLVSDVCPAWVATALSARTRDRESAVAEELDTKHNVDRAVHYLKGRVQSGNVAIEGSGGNAKTYETAAMLHDLGVSEEKAIELLLEHWSPYCEPPWGDDELRDEIHSPVLHAYQYAENEPGSKGVRDNVTNFTGITRDGKAVGKRPAEISRFKLRTEAEQDTRPEPKWIIPNWIQENSTVMLYGAPGSYKSFIALDIALSFAASKKALGLDYEPGQKFDVVYAAGEGAIGIEKLRRPSWKTHRMVTGEIPFYSVSDVPSAGEDPATVNELIEQIDEAGVKPGLIIFDTLSRMLAGLDENSAKDASLAVARIEEIKRNFNCVVMVVHHTGKDGKSERGSSAFRGGFDTLISCEREGEVVTMTVEKQKDAQEPKPWNVISNKVGLSLAFSAHVVKDTIHKGDKEDEDHYKRERNIIFKVLTEGGFTNRGNGIETKILADMYLREAGEMPEDVSEQNRAVDKKKNGLNRKAKTVLKNFVVSDYGDAPTWAILPTE